MAIQHPVLKQISALLDQAEEPILRLFESGHDAAAIQSAMRLKEFAVTYKAAGGTPTAADWKVIDAQMTARAKATANPLDQAAQQLVDALRARYGDDQAADLVKRVIQQLAPDAGVSGSQGTLNDNEIMPTMAAKRHKEVLRAEKELHDDILHRAAKEYSKR